jgi:hypothetical protein
VEEALGRDPLMTELSVEFPKLKNRNQRGLKKRVNLKNHHFFGCTTCEEHRWPIFTKRNPCN